MELLLWMTILVLVSSSIFFQLMKPRKSPQNSGKSPPSPPGLPLIGHLHLLSGGLPQHTLRRVAQRYGGVVHLQLGEIFAVVISSREAAQQVMKTVDPACADNAGRISTEIIWYNKNDIIFSSYGAHWRQMRRIMVSDLLSPRNLASFGQIRRDETSRLVSFLRSSAGAAVDLTGKVSEMTCSVVCRAAFGGVVRDADELVGLVKKAGIMTTGLELADLFPSSRLLDLLCLNKYRLWRMRRRLDAILEGIVEEHKETKSGGGEFGGEDIVDVLLRMQKDSQLLVPITDDAIKGFIIDTFSAGTETSSTAIDWAMSEMMRNPVVMAKAQAEVREAWKGKTNMDASNVDELKYLKSVVKETLRLHPPIPLLLRKCREACDVNGYSIPVNARVAVNVWSLGRDPLYWDEPEIFRPERFDVISKDFMGNNFEYIPFGAGRRICPGMNFGLANVEFPLAQLLYHFDWKLPRDMTAADVDMTETPGLSCPRKNALILVPMLYDP